MRSIDFRLTSVLGRKVPTRTVVVPRLNHIGYKELSVRCPVDSRQV